MIRCFLVAMLVTAPGCIPPPAGYAPTNDRDPELVDIKDLPEENDPQSDIAPKPDHRMPNPLREINIQLATMKLLDMTPSPSLEEAKAIASEMSEIFRCIYCDDDP